MEVIRGIANEESGVFRRHRGTGREKKS